MFIRRFRPLAFVSKFEQPGQPTGPIATKEVKYLLDSNSLL